MTAALQPSLIDELRPPRRTPVRTPDDPARYADDAEAVVYLMTKSSRLPCRRVYVMSRADAARFCDDPRTSGTGMGGPWAFAFTTYCDGWRDEPKSFRADDGRFAPLLAELGITPIYP